MVVSKWFGHKPCQFDDGRILTDDKRIEIKSIKKLRGYKLKMRILLIVSIIVFGLSINSVSYMTSRTSIAGFDLKILTAAKLLLSLLLFVSAVKALKYENCYKINNWRYLLLEKCEESENQSILTYIKNIEGAG